MGWRERYQQAKFRNVEFFVQRVEESGGRRTADHQFPGSDTGYVEDLGKKLQTFRIAGYILGDDYYRNRDELRRALNTSGVGTLIHPYAGQIEVACRSYRIQESTGEGRIARFDMDFIEAGELFLPESVVDTQADLVIKRTSVLDRIKEAFLATYSVIDKAYAVTQNIESTLRSGFGLLSASRQVVASASDFRRGLESAAALGDKLAFDAELQIDSIINLVSFGTTSDDDDFEATADNGIEQYNGIKQMWGYEPAETIDADDPSLVTSFAFSSAATAVCAGLIAVVEFTSVDEAEQVQNDLLGQIDILTRDSRAADVVISALRDLRSAVVEDIESRATDLPRQVSLTIPLSQPALTISSSLYGNLEHETEIIERNQIIHPGFAPGNQPIEVLL